LPRPAGGDPGPDVSAADQGGYRRTVLRRWTALFGWSYLTWTVLSWTRTAEQIAVGLVLSALAAVALAALGPVAAPWSVLHPRRALALARLAWYVGRQMVHANLTMSRRIWTPRMPLRSGMVVAPTRFGDEGRLAAVGLLTSVVVDTQLVDVDRDRRELQYHVVWVADDTDPNGPVEERLAAL
jgi:multicomponent Na+:H+ antiporter subunit E